MRGLPGAAGRIRVNPFDADFREYVWLALPLMLGLGLTTVDEWYEKWIGGQVAEGAIAAITYTLLENLRRREQNVRPESL